MALIAINTRFWDKVKIIDKPFEPNACWEWQAAFDDKGYGRIRNTTLNKVGNFIIKNRKMELAHRVSYKLTYGEFPENKLVLHKCDNPKCVRPDHLFLGDTVDNINDKVNKNRHAKGEMNGLISNKVMTQIKTCIANGEVKRHIARKFSCSPQHISNIANGLRRKEF